MQKGNVSSLESERPAVRYSYIKSYLREKMLPFYKYEVVVQFLIMRNIWTHWTTTMAILKYF